MFEAFDRLPQSYQGIISFIIGLLLLCYVFDIIVPGINIFVMAFALYLIGAGFMKSGLYNLFTNFINRFQK